MKWVGGLRVRVIELFDLTHVKQTPSSVLKLRLRWVVDDEG